jgi:hypothetical protein
VSAPITEPTHAANPLTPNTSGEHRPEPVPPQPNRIVANIDAALGQQTLYVPQ